MICNPLDLTGKTILVTGASSGIGRETAIYLAGLGARIVLSGRDVTRLETARAKLCGEHLVEALELSSSDEIPAWMKAIAGRTGPLHGVVHSAGISATRPLRTISQKEINSLMAINVSAAFGLAKGFRQKG